MLKIRYLLIALTMLLSSQTASADVRVSIGINLPVYPQLVVVPGYPVYYAPNLQANFFFYDGMYWIYQDDAWFVSSWYNGPWSFVEPEYVPVFVLRIPVRYYRQPPIYFYGWRRDAPPRWGDHWGRDWEQRRGSWDKWNRHATPAPAPLPVYQKTYSGDHYPHEVEQQHELQQQKYRYQPRDPVVQEHYQQQGELRAPGQQREFQQDKPREPEERAYKQQDIQRANPREQEPRQQDERAYPSSQHQGSQPQDRGGEDRQRSAPSAPQQQRPEMQDRGQQSQPGMQREQQMPRSQGQQERQQGRDAGREQRQGQGQERGRDRN
ncbi:MAG: hypothetical protein WC696_00870 [Candidatus Methylopumilus sp.]|jgi:hypothetical protein